MKYFLLDMMGDANDGTLCFLGNNIEGLGMDDWRLLDGEPMGTLFPAGAKWFMDNEHPGMKLTSMLGNRQCYFPCAAALRAVVEKTCPAGVEYLPFMLYDHRKRIASKEYCLVHPLGALDCLDEKASQVRYSKSGKAVGKAEFILDAAKIKAAPQMFRIAKFTSEIVLGQTLVDAIAAAGLTNVIVAPLKVVGSV